MIRMKNDRRSFLKNTLSLSALTALAPATMFANDAPDDAPSSIWKKNKFVTKPYLQNPTDSSITIIWLVNLNSYSFVEYGETKELGSIAKTVRYGMVEANNTFNKIKLTNLKPNTKYYYRAVSKEISKFKPYDIRFGKTISSEIYSFTTLDPQSSEVSMVIMNDLHNDPSSISHLINFADKNETDFVFFNGDILSHTDSEKQVINDLLKVCSDSFATEIPYYFTRGNHEVRGEYARELGKYFDEPSNKFYYDFTWGDTHFTVLDTGEDKEDSHEVFAGLVDFDDYRLEQLEWFKNKVSKSDAFVNAKFRVVLMHIPFFYSDDWFTTLQLRDMYAELFNETKIDVCISGHTHEYKLREPGTVDGFTHNYAIVIGGGPAHKDRTLTKLNADSNKLEISMLDNDGNEIENYTIGSKK